MSQYIYQVLYVCNNGNDIKQMVTTYMAWSLDNYRVGFFFIGIYIFVTKGPDKMIRGG
jgi:hypothetical protein